MRHWFETWSRLLPPRKLSWLVAAVGLGALRAQDPFDALSDGWRWRVFDRQEGLGASSVSAVWQDQREFVYAAAERGLWRYDLWEWTSVENAQAFDDGEVTRFLENTTGLFAVTANAVWKVEGGATLKLFYRGGGVHAAANDLGEIYILSEREGKHLQLRGEAMEIIDAGVKLPSGRVLGYEIDAGRVHWLATTDGLFSRDMSRRSWREVADRDLDAALQGKSCSRVLLIEGTGGRELWGVFAEPRDVSSDGVLARLRNGVWALSAAAGVPAVRRILSDTNHHYYATADDGRLFFSREGSEWAPVSSPGLGNKVALHGGTLDSAGVLWFRLGTGGVAAYDPLSRRWESLPTGIGQPFPNVLSLLETQEGDVWLGMTKGVARLRPGADPEPQEAVQGTPLGKVTGLGQDAQGRVWISSAESFNGAFHFDPESSAWVRVTEAGFQDHPVRRIVRDRGGELWFLSRERTEASEYVIYRSSMSTAYDLRRVRVPHGPVNDLARTPEDLVWMATDDGLLSGTVEGDAFRLEKRLTEVDGLLSLQVWAVAEGPDGAIWVCYPSSASGVTRFKGGVAQSFQEADGLSSSEVWSIAAAGQSLWFGTSRGLSRFDGDCWYAYPVASSDFSTSRVWPVAASRREPDCILLGTFGQGALRFRMDDRRRPQFARRELPARVQGREVRFAWDARDHRSVTRPDALLFRSRLDRGAWTPFTTERSRELKDLAAGDHVFEVEVRDLAGNRSREELVHHFRVGEPRFAGLFWLAVTGGGAAAVLPLGWIALWQRRRQRRAGRYLGLFQAFPGPALIVDRTGRVEDWNGKASAWLGVDGATRADVKGRPLSLLPAFFSEEARIGLKRVLEGESVRLLARVPAPGRRETVLEVSSFPLAGRRSTVAGAVILVEDATARAAEARREEQEKRLASLRRLAGRVAREWSDAGVARKLAAFAGSLPLNGQPARVGVNDRLAKLLAARFPGSPTVKVDYRAQPGLWDAAVEPELFEEAVAEVLRNALEALNGKGAMTVRTGNLRLDDDPALPPGAYVEVRVEDTGQGIEPSHMERLFEPFHSTKAGEGNLGVGLAFAYGVARSSGGDLRVESRPGRGTVARMLLVAAR